MKKGKEEITIKVNKQLKQLCDKYGISVEQLFLQMQEDMIGGRTLENYYRQILAELYLTEMLSEKTKVDRSAVESVLNYMRSYKTHRATKQPLPKGLSDLTQKILKDCDYRKKHSKN